MSNALGEIFKPCDQILVMAPWGEKAILVQMLSLHLD
jgi:hypothetical protein